MLRAQFTLWMITAYSMWQDGWRLEVIYTLVTISKHISFFEVRKSYLLSGYRDSLRTVEMGICSGCWGIVNYKTG